MRDGSQSYGLFFSLQDKITLAHAIDQLGLKYIEGGWPGSNPKDKEFFKAVKSIKFENSEIVAFGSTRKKNNSAKNDLSLNTLVDSGVNTVIIYGKSWLFHVENILKTTAEENLSIISDSIEYLIDNDINVIFDCEHFFDGYADNPDYAISVAKLASDSGASTIVLCDTNGGTLPSNVASAVSLISKQIKTKLGIHTHNDLGLAVANTLSAVNEGALHVQGTMNGLGERTGNVDLCQVIPILHFKLGLQFSNSSLSQDLLVKNITSISKLVYELANLSSYPRQPFVGSSSFAHKGGVHIDAVLKHTSSYENIDPALVGNTRILSVSELSGRSAIIEEASKLGIALSKKDSKINNILTEIKDKESKGYYFEIARASIHLIILKTISSLPSPFSIHYWRTTASNDELTNSIGEVVVKIDDSVYHETSKGNGPVHALDQAFRQAIFRHFPELEKVELINYKVTVIDDDDGTASKVRVFITFGNKSLRWSTVSVSTNILEASVSSLSEGYMYPLMINSLKK